MSNLGEEWETSWDEEMASSSIDLILGWSWMADRRCPDQENVFNVATETSWNLLVAQLCPLRMNQFLAMLKLYTLDALWDLQGQI